MILTFVGFTTFSMGAFVALIITVVMLKRRSEVRHAALIARTPTVPIAQAQPGLVEIRGALAPGPDGLVRSPLSGRDAALYRIDLLARSSKNTSHVATERERRPFFIDDGSGQRALVHPAEATLVARYRRYGRGIQAAVVIGDVPMNEHPLGPEQRAWIASKAGGDASSERVYAEERLLGPGDLIYALGVGVREPGPDGPAQLVLRHQAGEERGLYLSDLSEEELLRTMNTRRKSRRVLLVVGLGMAVFGLLLMAYGVSGRLGL